jgi:hypothetical protein
MKEELTLKNANKQLRIGTFSKIKEGIGQNKPTFLSISNICACS